MKPIVKIITTGVVVLAALGMIAYKYRDYVKFVDTGRPGAGAGCSDRPARIRSARSRADPE
jgi:hypothetical protein